MEKWALTLDTNYMFSGIVQGYTNVTNLLKKPYFKNFSIFLEDNLINGLDLGASVSIDGVCMTVVKIEGSNVYFDAMKETLECTTLGALELGDTVNIERSVKYGDEIGGHQVSGHVHGKARIMDIDRTIENNVIISFQVPIEWIKFLFPKGFVALNGASLTLVDVERERNIIKVSFIPETLRQTTFGIKEIGDQVNLEVDQQTQSIVETVERYLSNSNKHKN